MQYFRQTFIYDGGLTITINAITVVVALMNKKYHIKGIQLSIATAFSIPELFNHFFVYVRKN